MSTNFTKQLKAAKNSQRLMVIVGSLSTGLRFIGPFTYQEMKAFTDKHALMSYEWMSLLDPQKFE